MVVCWTRRLLVVTCVILALAATIGGAALAEQIPTPKGAVILTIAGDIDKSNRGAAHPKRDGFLKFHDIAFQKAFVFDREILEGFPPREIKAQPPQYAKPVTFRGPLLKDVLKALGAEGASIQTRALDGFAVDLSAKEIAAEDWTLAVTADAKPLGIGAQGPVWLMHTPSTLKVPHEEEQRWPWALFYIDVKK